MKANVQYNDFNGSVAADISDDLGNLGGDSLESIGKYFKLDKNRFEIVGLSIYGTEDFSISLICVDKENSANDKECIVKMIVDVGDETEILDILFKRLHIVLYNKDDEKYSHMDYDKEINFSDFHKGEK